MSGRRKKYILHRLVRWTRPLRDTFNVPVLDGCRRVVQLMPHGCMLAVGRAFGRLAWLLCIRAKSRVRRQLALTGLASDSAALRRMTREVFESLGMTALEWLHSLTWSREYFLSQVRFEGIEKFQPPPTGKQGLIIVSAHLGNWELIPAAFKIHTGRVMSAVMAEQRNARLNEWMVRLRQESGTHLLSSKSSALSMLRHVLHGGVLALLSDQDSSQGRGTFVDFFGLPAYTPAGAAHLAWRTGAPIVPLTISRDLADPRRHVIHAGELIQVDRTCPEADEVQRITQAFTQQIEAQIRAHPSQWVWVHDRWHHRPGSKIRIRSSKNKKKGSKQHTPQATP